MCTSPISTDARQRAFHDHTCRLLGLGKSAGKQPSMARDQRISDSVHTATRMLIDPPAGFDAAKALCAAATAGFETLARIAVHEQARDARISI